MKKSIESKWVQLALYIIITIIMVLILVPLLDNVYALITRSPFVYSVHEHIQRPTELGLVLGIVFWAVQNGIKKMKRNKKWRIRYAKAMVCQLL